MVAEYLDKNYDRVCISFCLSPCLSAQMLPPVFLLVHDPDPVQQLRDEAAVTEAARRDPFGPRQLQRDDQIHCQRGQPEDDDESVAR